MSETILFSKEEETQNQFMRAKEIPLFSQGDAGNYNSLAKRYKGIVDEANETNILNVVSPGYKIVQHDELYDSVTKAIKESGLKADLKVLKLCDGARIRMTATFPDLFLKIGDPSLNDIVSFRMAFDNSYNGTTGIRTCVDGMRLKCLNGMKVPESFARYYHKHTQGLELGNVATTIEKGVNTFLSKIKDRWERYYQTKIDPAKARLFLSNCLEDKVQGVAGKYLEEMLKRFDHGGNIDIRGEGQITNQWMLYNLVTEVMTHSEASVDVQDTATNKMDSLINSNINKLVSA